MHPLLNNITGLTDDDLNSKRAEIYQKIAWAYRMGHSSMVGQLQMIADDYNFELARRNQKLMDDMQARSKNHTDKIQIG